MKFDVFGIENPLIDLLSQVPDSFFAQVGVEKDRMYLIETERHHELLAALKDHAVHPEPGGSCANTLLGIAQLGGKTAYCGKAGEDEFGQIYADKLEEAGVKAFIDRDPELLTGSTVILVAPDAARTMNTYLGACQHLKASDVPVEALQASSQLYITGYLWDTETQQEAATLALKTAKDAGIPIAMSLSDPFCVNRHKDAFIEILKNYVGLVFANQEEAFFLTDTTNTHDAMEKMRSWCDSVVITLGAHGALVSEGSQTVYVDPFPVKAIDTTGAGDAFAAGFLWGKSTGKGLAKSGRLGAAFAAKVITHMGPRLEGDVKAQLSELLGEAL